MQNLIYLILIVLAGGAGWMAGSWSGRDAKQALEGAKDMGKQVTVVRDNLQTEIDTKLQTLKAEHDAEVQKLRAGFDAETLVWKKQLADRPAEMKVLDQKIKAAQANVDKLQAERKLLTDPKQIAALNATIAQQQRDIEAARVRNEGLKCSQQPVPEDMLARLRGGA
jgi:hypothetical protein